MTIDQLKCFFEVAHCRSFSKAAERLFLSQSNLSKYIKSLETELGTALFDRSTHHCRLTEEGSLLFRQTEDLFFQLNSRLEDTKLRSRTHYHLVYVGISPGEPPHPDFLELLKQQNTFSHTHRYVMVEHNYTDLISKLGSRELDFIVTTDRNARAVDSFSYQILCPIRMLLAVHKDNPKASQEHLRPRDCADNIVFLSIPDGKNAPVNRIREFEFHVGCNMSPIMLPSPSDILNNVMVSAGIGIIPQTVNPANYPDVRFFTFDDGNKNAGQYLVWRNDLRDPEMLRFIEKVRSFSENE